MSWSPVCQLARDARKKSTDRVQLVCHPDDEHRLALRRCRGSPESKGVSNTSDAVGRVVAFAGQYLRGAKRADVCLYVRIASSTGTLIVVSSLGTASKNTAEAGVHNCRCDSTVDTVPMRNPVLSVVAHADCATVYKQAVICGLPMGEARGRWPYTIGRVPML